MLQGPAGILVGIVGSWQDIFLERSYWDPDRILISNINILAKSSKLKEINLYLHSFYSDSDPSAGNSS